MDDCLLHIYSEQRFANGGAIGLSFAPCCNRDGTIHLVCQYDPNVGVFFGGHIVFSNDDFFPHFHAIYDQRPEEVWGTAQQRNFFEKYKQVASYSFYCTPSIADEPRESLEIYKVSNLGVLEKKGGFSLWIDDTEYPMANSGAIVDLFIPYSFDPKPARRT
jgi:hypothetical protein